MIKFFERIEYTLLLICTWIVCVVFAGSQSITYCSGLTRMNIYTRPLTIPRWPSRVAFSALAMTSISASGPTIRAVPVSEMADPALLYVPFEPTLYYSLQLGVFVRTPVNLELVERVLRQRHPVTGSRTVCRVGGAERERTARLVLG
jgi:hypothetical protein